MGIRRAVRIIILFSMIILPVRSGFCDIYTYVDENGVRHFTNVPHLSNVKYDVYIKEADSRRAPPPDPVRYDHSHSEYDQCGSPLKKINSRGKYFNFLIRIIPHDHVLVKGFVKNLIKKLIFLPIMIKIHGVRL